MAFVKVHPRYRSLVERLGLVTPTAFLELPSVILCGHPDRHVARVTLGAGTDSVTAFLKREHRIPWRERLSNARAGFGFVSKSEREAAILHTVHQQGIRCPEWIAVGADDQGRAFLLLRALTAGHDLPSFLQEQRDASPEQRRRFARRLGRALAQLHRAGFVHRDLYAKHVWVDADAQTVQFLDWQRAGRQHGVGWRQRCRDLASLEATLANDLATERERLACLCTYLHTSRGPGRKRVTDLRSWMRVIRRHAERLLQQRRIRELRRLPMQERPAGLIWQDGEALCLTVDFHAELAGQLPDWLRLKNAPLPLPCGAVRHWVPLPQGSRGLLVRRSEYRRLWDWRRWLGGRPPTSPEVRQAGLLFRLRRAGIGAPRLLAFGERTLPGRRVNSFLLTAPPPATVPLTQWLAQQATPLAERRQVIRAAATLLRRLHDLHYSTGGQCDFAVVAGAPGDVPEVILGRIDHLRSRRHPSPHELWTDLAALARALGRERLWQTDGLRLVLSYVQQPRLRSNGKRLARTLLRYHRLSASADPGVGSQSVARVRLQPAGQGGGR